MERIMKYAPILTKWIPESIIGRGSFGTVYCVYDQNAFKTDKRAVKLITIEHKKEYSAAAETFDDAAVLSENQKDIKKCIQEMQIADMLSKYAANVVCVHEYQIQPNGDTTDILLLMDYLTSLQTRIEAAPLELDEIIKLGIDMCHTLKVCEEQGVVHRDIKPENIFIDANGRYLLGDFGLAREIKNAKESLRKRSGTPMYLSPEGMDLFVMTDCKSDQYSLGILLYQLLNDGRIPLCDDMNDVELVWDSINKRRTCKELPPPVNETGRLWEIVKKACAISKEDRYSSAGDMKAALQALLDGKPEEAVEEIESPKTSASAEPVSESAPEEAGKIQMGPGVLMVQEDDSLVSPRLFHRFPAEKIRRVRFLDSMQTAPDYAEDLSEGRNRSVLGWMEGSCLIIAGNGGVKANPDSSNLFFKCTNLSTIDFSRNFDTSDTVNMFGMFLGCRSLSEIDFSGIDTSEVRDMRFLFQDCASLRTLDLSGFHTANTLKMSSMFAGCINLTELDFSSFDLSNVQEKQYMFTGCPYEKKWEAASAKQAKKKGGIIKRLFHK